ncbi:(NiFe) hydrogenase maturation protein HypF [Desulfovibrio sp. X2]|uniref:carbamoyltransferase HypF n=1 Tax=Desulfovibrio sp. X2 TaxID=941449 RepID=UPI000358D06B|nr:carbamoyltransferase HypF [Desulfovibrio sp. X2]EPR44325.1 (NiFe) hydrogenase maturation protein HypF [Desulfovibrio sp. X2]
MEQDTTSARERLVVTGQVQGVGFRPFVYRLAMECGLSGRVANTPAGVAVEVQGAPGSVEDFARRLAAELPPLARIVRLTRETLPPLEGEAEFSIVHSEAGEGHQVLISPDTATCPDCLAELFDPGNRRFLYPFINCTNCGPRYTITRSIPYDRPFTSMACFPLCDDCRGEYEDPLDRRFHAQPNACPVCGPRVWLADAAGRELCRGDEAGRECARHLAQGRIAAVKGLGGFHLAVDALNEVAVARLRERKHRPGKPLAVMVRDLAAARALAEVGEAEAALMSGIERPIVLCRRKSGGALPSGIAPDTDFVGLMLPYAPLQHVLFHHLCALSGDGAALVMTSGNVSGDPIALGNREALARLSDIADVFLLHDRDILIRADDSVVRPAPALPGEGGAQAAPLFLRRSRGYTPRPVFLDRDGPCVLGTGPELKNTLCLTKGEMAFVSQHIGDMENLATFGFWREIAAHLADILQVRPSLMVHDLHPGYMTTRHALEQAGEPGGLPVAGLAHHYAHAHAVLAENRFSGRALVLALDGTGLGEDDTLWGGECLLVDTESLDHARLGSLTSLRLPGGEAAIREPWRVGAAALWELGETDAVDGARPWLPAFGKAAEVVAQMLEKNLNCPATTSCGRLFDAAAALCGLGLSISYEAQAAILLEQAQDMAETGAYPCPVKEAEGRLVLDARELLAALWADVRGRAPDRAVVGRAARRFHLGLAQGLAELARAAAEASGTDTVGLSGGCLLNLSLARDLPRALAARGLSVLVHRELPPGDGCVSLGQAVWGRLFLG